MASELALTTSKILEPKILKTALRSLEWYTTMKEKVSALHQNKTRTLVSSPINANVVGSKWVFYTKYTENGSVDRLKAQLIAKGFTQILGMDFDKILP